MGDETFYYQETYNGHTGNYTGDFAYTRPLWAIDNVKIKKGYGITNPHVPFRAEEVTAPSSPAGVINVPSVEIPAWTQVIHSGYGSYNYGLSPNTAPYSNVGAGIDNGNWSSAVVYGTAEIHSSHEYTTEYGGQYDAYLRTEQGYDGTSHQYLIPADLAAPSFGGTGANNPTGLPGFGLPNFGAYDYPDQSSDFATPFTNTGGSQGANYNRVTQSHADYLTRCLILLMLL